jgi:L-ribulose-5-phosphate 3-epimerase
MGPNRRELLSGLGAAALRAQEPEKPPARTRPMICLFSKHLPKLQYTELGGVIKTLGFEGCDLTVRKGGHVLPEQAPVDLVRAIECIRGDGVEVPMITTDLLSASDPYARNVLGIAGQIMRVPYFKPGYYRYTGAASIEAKLAEVRRDLAGLAGMARAYGIATGFHNHSGDYVGEAVWDIRALIADLDPRWVGYYFDPCHATAEGGAAGWNVSLRLALPRLKMMAMKDFYWEKRNGKWQMKMCAMGEGMVDWPRVFAMLAQANFTGPLSLHIEYDPADELAAIAKDVAYVEKQVAAAYGAAGSRPQPV